MGLCRSFKISMTIIVSSEILTEERNQLQETMRRENRRVQAMSWGESSFGFIGEKKNVEREIKE